MTLNVEEKHAAAGALAASAVPQMVNRFNLDNTIVGLADALFEGNRGPAKMVVGGGFLLIGIGLIAAAVHTDIDDTAGMAAIGVAVGAFFVAGQAFLSQRGN
jgi:membrane-associated phospholipid phosphatase